MIKIIFTLLFMLLNLYSSIDMSKKAILVTDLVTLQEAKNLASKLTNYDIYIRESIKDADVLYFDVYVVNIIDSKRANELKKIKKYSSSAYNCSTKKLKVLVDQPKKNDLFIDYNIIKQAKLDALKKAKIVLPNLPIKKTEPEPKLIKNVIEIIEKKSTTKQTTTPLNNTIPTKASFLNTEDNTIKIALVGPLSGKHKSSGTDMLRALELKISEINENGGIQNRQIEILTFDDKNDKKLATEMAKKASKSDAIAVIGHRWSSTTGKGIEVYKKFNLPVISGTATSTSLTKGNNVFFRAVPSNAQESRTLAYYLRYVLKKNQVTIIYDADAFGVNLYEEFVIVANQIGLKIKAQYKVDRNSKTLEQDSIEVVRKIKESDQEGGIFFATHDKQTVPLVYHLRQNNIRMPIIGSSAMAKVSFAKRFEIYPLEQENKGYYTNNIYCAIPMLFDIGGEKANQFKNRFKKKFKDDFENRFKTNINAANAAYYDAITIVIKALKDIDLNQNKEAVRASLRDKLSSMDKAHLGIEGVTGYVFFNKDGDLDKKTFISKFQKQQLVSAQVQINDITNLALDDFIKNTKLTYAELKKEYPSILRTKTGFLTQKEIVKIGFKLYKVSDIDVVKKTARLNFDMWIIDRGELNLKELYFPNAIDKISFEKPTAEKITAEEVYQRFRIDATFAIDFDTTKFNVNQHLIGFTFAVKRKSDKELQLVPDILNIKYYTGDDFINNINKEQVFDDKTLKVRTASFYAGNKHLESLAEPLLTQIGIDDYYTSNVNLFITYDKKAFNTKQYISFEQAPYVVAIALLILILFYFIRIFLLNKKPDLKYSFFGNLVYFILKISLIYALFYSIELIILDLAVVSLDRLTLENIALALNILFVIINAKVIITLLNEIVWLPLEHRSKKETPSLLKSIISFLIYLSAFLIIYKFILYQDIATLLASMGILTMVIGFAIQSNISNIFSGLALNIENTIDVGDWIEFTGYPEGQVVDINWRTTTVRCRDGRLVNIPNAVASESPLTNFSKSEYLMQVIFIDINMKHNPELVKGILLQTMQNIDGILDTPAPETGLKEIDEWEVKYKLVYHISDYNSRFHIEQQVWTNAWENLRASNIEPSIDRKEIRLINNQKTITI